MFYLKDSGSALITAYAFGVALATVTVLLCGRFVVLSRQNWLQTMFEPRHICWHIQIIDPLGAQVIAECLL